jgi:hypothetical protein
MKAPRLRHLSLASLFMLACSSNRLDVGGGRAIDDVGAVPAKHKGFIEKVDLLFVVDNSISMADKQAELGRRVPELIKALTAPDLDPLTGKPTHQPVRDLHVAFISSSLGSFGTSACAPKLTTKSNDDRGHLLPREGDAAKSGWKFEGAVAEPVAAACSTLQAATTLTWSADAADSTATFRGATGATELQVAASCAIETVKESGCGYEQPLEAMYRFLVEPAPYESASAACSSSISGDTCTGSITKSGVDETLLAQRRAFLRPDSLVAVVLLSDENDASFKAEGPGWLPLSAGRGQMPRAWAACSSAPDDVDDDAALAALGCRSCADDSSDSACAIPWPSAAPNVDADGRNTRAFEQGRRFGKSFLYPVQRYVDGLTKRKIALADGTLAPNPLFEGGRSLDLVVVAGILGVPSKLVNDERGFPRPMTEADWERAISTDLTKRDPHMIESIAPRPGLARYAGDPAVDPVHGGDRDAVDADDLQYACIGVRSLPGASGDCTGASPDRTNPLCAASGDQLRFKAYPALRELRVIHGVAGSGFVASICDRTYRGAVAGIVRKIQDGCQGE